MMGVCAVCQEKVPISFSRLARAQEEERGFDDRDIDMTYGDSIDYLCDHHVFYGEGSGQIPQAVIKS